MTKHHAHRLILTILFLFSLSQTGQTKEIREFFPIDLSKAGNSAVVKFHISRFANWITKNNPISLALQIIPPPKGQESLTPKFNDLILSLTGTPFYGILTEYKIAHPGPHHEINLHVVWIDDDSGAVLKEQDISSGHTWWGRTKVIPGTSFPLDAMALSSGNFSIIVTTLSDDSRFDGTFSTGLCTGINVK